MHKAPIHIMEWKHKEETKTIRMGGENGFDLTIKNGKIYHKSEDITSYVESIYTLFGQNNFNCNTKRGNGNWDFIIEDAILSKTGCERKETKISEWLNLYKLIS